MIKVNILNNEIEVKGHASYDEYGKDIVCASVSTLIILTVNLTEKFNKLDKIDYKIESGYFKMKVSNDEIVDVLYDNFKNTLCDLASQYPKYIKINR